MPEVFGFVAQTLSQKGMILDYYFLFWDKVWATKPKTLGNEPKGICNDDLSCISQIFLPKTMGNDTMPCGFIYVIAPLMFNIYYYIYILRCGCQMFWKCIYGSNLLLFDVCASELRVRFLDEWFDWLPIYIINQSTWLFFYHMIYFCAFFLHEFKIKGIALLEYFVAILV